MDKYRGTLQLEVEVEVVVELCDGDEQVIVFADKSVEITDVDISPNLHITSTGIIMSDSTGWINEYVTIVPPVTSPLVGDTRLRRNEGRYWYMRVLEGVCDCMCMCMCMCVAVDAQYTLRDTDTVSVTCTIVSGGERQFKDPRSALTSAIIEIVPNTHKYVCEELRPIIFRITGEYPVCGPVSGLALRSVTLI